MKHTGKAVKPLPLRVLDFVCLFLVIVATAGSFLAVICLIVVMLFSMLGLFGSAFFFVGALFIVWRAAKFDGV